MSNIYPGRLIESVNGQRGVVYIQEDKYYVHDQAIPNTVWVVNHGLNKMPAITVIDTGKNIVEGDVRYIDDNSIEITFSVAFGGKAICN